MNVSYPVIYNGAEEFQTVLRFFRCLASIFASFHPVYDLYAAYLSYFRLVLVSVLSTCLNKARY